jgi:hypothetical protein
LPIFADQNKNRTLHQAATGRAGESRCHKLFERTGSLPWSTEFDDPIILPDGRRLHTLKDAADYITKVAETRIRPGAVASRDRGADALQSRRSCDVGADRVFEGAPDAKKHHWGKRKLKRDQ